MNHFALYDGNSGMFRWFGPAPCVADAIRALDSEVIGGLCPSGPQRLGVHVGTEAQIAAIRRWHAQPSHGFPKDVGSSAIYDATELTMIIEKRERASAILVEKLRLNELSVGLAAN